MSKIRDLMHWNRPSLVPVSYGESWGQSLASLQEDMNRMFDHIYNSTMVYATNWDGKTPSTPAVNIFEQDDSFKVETALAGFDPKNISVETTDGFLTIRGEKTDEQKVDGGAYLRQEIAYGSFFRTIELPETADPEKIEATFRNGILTMTVRKKAAALQKPRKISIKQAA